MALDKIQSCRYRYLYLGNSEASAFRAAPMFVVPRENRYASRNGIKNLKLIVSLVHFSGRSYVRQNIFSHLGINQPTKSLLTATKLEATSP